MNRDKVIAELVDRDWENTDLDNLEEIFKDILANGNTPYSNYTDEELEEVYINYFSEEGRILPK